MIWTAIGAAASAPKPPPFTMTPTAIFRLPLPPCVKQVKTGAPKELAVTGAFIAIGHTPNTRIFEGQLEMANGYIVTRGGRDGDYTVVRITHPDLVTPLQLLFQKEWRRGTVLQLR